MKLLVYSFLLLACAVQTVCAHTTDREQLLISHVKNSIQMGEAQHSKLTTEVLSLEGMSSSKERHFFNNLCSLPETHYFEIGVWKGSTYISALFSNAESVKSAVAIDNWAEFDGPCSEFISNVAKHLPKYAGRFYSADCFAVNTQAMFSAPVNIYFYDGWHSEEAQKKAFTYFNDVLDDVFIAVVDDWNYHQVGKGTYAAFKELKYEILYEQVLPARFQGDLEQWWNGLYVAVIRKPAK